MVRSSSLWMGLGLFVTLFVIAHANPNNGRVLYKVKTDLNGNPIGVEFKIEEPDTIASYGIFRDQQRPSMSNLVAWWWEDCTKTEGTNSLEGEGYLSHDYVVSYTDCEDAPRVWNWALVRDANGQLPKKWAQAEPIEFNLHEKKSVNTLSFLAGFALLFPGILVLGMRARWEWKTGKKSPRESENATSKEGDDDHNSRLIIVCLTSWSVTFVFLLILVLWGGVDRLSFFHPQLDFHVFVPVFGFLGAMIFVIDLFRGKAVKENSEFALRLVLGPYVAIVMVLLFRGSIPFVDIAGELEAQAALAFLSGFLVVLFLQGLTERGNEFLGQWRERSRYEPSEIAKKFKLDRDDDLSLRTKADLKYLEQLRTLPEKQLEEKSRQGGLGEDFLRVLRSRLQVEHLESKLGEGVWSKLKAEGVKTAWDVALLTPPRIKEISEKQGLNHEALTAFYRECKRFVTREVKPAPKT